MERPISRGSIDSLVYENNSLRYSIPLNRRLSRNASDIMSDKLIINDKDKKKTIKNPIKEDERIEPVDENHEGAILCGICCDYYLDNAMFSLSCKHSYCKNCMADHLKTKIVDGQV